MDAAVWRRCRDLPAGAKRLWADEAGQDLVEYALLTAAVGFVAIAAWDSIRAALANTYGTWQTSINDLWEPPAPAGS